MTGNWVQGLKLFLILETCMELMESLVKIDISVWNTVHRLTY